MSGALFPVFDVPNIISENAGYDASYKHSVRWDIDKGDFARDSAGRLVECDGKEAYMIWCFKTAQTERYACLAYPSAIGVEMEAATYDDDVKTVESMVQRTVTDALMVNPRTEYVRDFVFSWDGDDIHCEFSVKGIDWDAVYRIAL